MRKKRRRERRRERRGKRGKRGRERNTRVTCTVIKSPILTTYCMCEEEEERRGGEEEECHVAVTKSPILTPLFWAWVTL